MDWKKVLRKGFQYQIQIPEWKLNLRLKSFSYLHWALGADGFEGGGFNARLEALTNLPRKVHRGVVLGFVKISQGKGRKPRQLLTADIFFTMTSNSPHPSNVVGYSLIIFAR